jgi:hypothetical protein
MDGCPYEVVKGTNERIAEYCGKIPADGLVYCPKHKLMTEGPAWAAKSTERSPTAGAVRYALVLRTSDKDLRSYNGFQWPEKGPVSCPDWDPAPKCGNGLHGLMWGDGDASLLSSSADAKWQVVKVEESKIVAINNQKCKFPEGEVVFTGSMADAMAMVLCDRWHIDELLKNADKKVIIPSEQVCLAFKVEEQHCDPSAQEAR